MHDILNNLRFVETNIKLADKKRKNADRPGPWTDEELETLYRVYPTSTREEIIEAIPNRTWDAIKNKAVKEKLKIAADKRAYKHSSKAWSSSEDTLLEIFWADSPESVMQALLPNRTILAMTNRACALGLCRNTGTFNLKERAIIEQINVLGKVETMRQLPGHSWNTISQYARNKMYISMNVIPDKDLELLKEMLVSGYNNKQIETMLCITPQIRGRAIKALKMTKV